MICLADNDLVLKLAICDMLAEALVGYEREIENMRTIVARLTPTGRAALATIGILGPAATTLAGRLFCRRVDLSTASTERHFFGRFGEAVQDEVVLRVVRRAPIEEVELHSHGGPALVDELLRQLAAHGAEIVDWHVYLMRRGASAVAIEAADALGRCPTARCAQILLDQVQGALEAAFERIERHGDRHQLVRLRRWSRLGLHLTNPWKVVLFGRANVGKSSLLNAIAGFQRAIVAPAPGTTRDIVRLRTAFDGWPVAVSDGAGFRDAPGPIEQAGIALLFSERAAADLAVMVVDLSEPPTPLDASLRRDLAPDLVVGNKADLPLRWPAEEAARLETAVSAVTGEGIGTLVDRLAHRLVPDPPPMGEAVPFTHRQARLVEELAQVLA